MPEPTLPRYPTLYQLNTRVWLTALSRRLGRPATLADVPDEELDRLATAGFDWIWLLSLWQTGPASRQVSRTNLEWRHEFESILPDLTDDDIAGSGFALTGYAVDQRLGGDAALADLRARLSRRGIRLLLDFVPNHTGLDHPWVDEHPEYYVSGSELDLINEPGNYRWIGARGGERLLAHGRDPYFAGWSDTLQLDYSNAHLRDAMQAELVAVSQRCDGVRCDMAMLVLPDVFERTWGRPAVPFWAEAIGRVHEERPDFMFMAEVYWDLESRMLDLGFDYAYDKRLYDRLRAGLARPVREHLGADLCYQDRLARFLENHDEPRAAATFRPGQEQAAAVVTYLSPGLRFFHQGQFEGRRVRIPPHLVRAPEEPADPLVEQLYDALLALLRKPTARAGAWRQLECQPAWEGNPTWDNFIAFEWQGPSDDTWLIALNYGQSQGQCYIRIGGDRLRDSTVWLTDQLSAARYVRSGDDLHDRGLYLDLPAWGHHAFALALNEPDVRGGSAGPPPGDLG